MAKKKKRPDGTGGIFQLKNGKYRVRVYMDVRQDGRLVKKAIERQAKTRAGANAKLAELLRMKQGQSVAPDEITGSQWIDEYLKFKADSCQKKTLNNYQGPLETLRTWFGDERLHKLDILALREMVRDQKSEYARYDLRRKVKGCLQQAVRDKRLSENPMAGEPLKKPKPKKDPFTSEERLAICKDRGVIRI